MAESIFEDITQRWFITEPALFAIFCTHHLEQNSKMTCPLRTGRGVIQYNPNLIPKDNKAREEYLRTELVRIMLKHPYERQPENVRKVAAGIASDMVLSDNLDLEHRKLIDPYYLNLVSGNHFEWYAHEIDKMIEPGDDLALGGLTPDQMEAFGELAELWSEDDFMATEINEVVRSIKDWGSLPGKVVEEIKANLNAKIDYRKALAGLRASIISTLRSLTRMRPNPRFGFDAMGSKYDMQSKILVAVDVSGSISSRSLKNFFGVISRFFKFGITTLDVVQFDAGIQGEPMRLDKAFNADTSIKVLGRGGTNFQVVFDYIKEHKQYDGLIIFTDGYAPEPKVNFATQTKVLWVCQSEMEYNDNQEWMARTGRVCFIETD